MTNILWFHSNVNYRLSNFLIWSISLFCHTNHFLSLSVSVCLSLAYLSASFKLIAGGQVDISFFKWKIYWNIIPLYLKSIWWKSSFSRNLSFSIFTSVPIFKSLPEETLIKISDVLEETFYQQGDYIVSLPFVAIVMFILHWIQSTFWYLSNHITQFSLQIYLGSSRSTRWHILYHIKR